MSLLAKAYTLGNLSIAEGNPSFWKGDMTRKAPAARSVDGVPRSHRDRKEIAVEAAGRLMAKYPHSAVAVKDLQSGETGRLQARSRPAPLTMCRRNSRPPSGAGWRGRSCERTCSSYAAAATLGGPTPGRL